MATTSRGWLRELGRSGLTTSAIALGLAALGRPGYLNLGHGHDFEDRSVKALADRTLAIAAVLAQPWTDTVLSGASTVAQFESNLAAFQVGSDATLGELAPLTEAPEVYWNTRSGLRWT